MQKVVSEFPRYIVHYSAFAVFWSHPNLWFHKPACIDAHWIGKYRQYIVFKHIFVCEKKVFFFFFMSCPQYHDQTTVDSQIKCLYLYGFYFGRLMMPYQLFKNINK